MDENRAVGPPPPPRDRTVYVDGPIHMADFGGRGRPVVLVHGLGSSHAIWLETGALLADHARVVAIDLPGFGYTPLGRRSAAVDVAAGVLARVIRELFDGPAVVIGNSMGGVVTMLAAGSDPGAVEGVVLVDPGLRRPHGVHLERAVVRRFGTILIPFLGEGNLAKSWDKLGPEGVVRASLELCCVDPTRVPTHVVDALVEVVEHVHRSPGARRAYLEATRSLVRLAGSHRHHHRLVTGFDQPTLLVTGEEDRLVPVAAARAVAAERPDWSFEVIAGIGHTPQLEAAADLVGIVTSWMARELV
jgi:pimeloyl-ACP methyl ester carboxylesterase